MHTIMQLELGVYSLHTLIAVVDNRIWPRGSAMNKCSLKEP